MSKPVEIAAGRYCGTEGAANRLGVTVSRVRQLVREGRLPSIEVSPRAWLVSETDLDRFIAARNRAAK